MEEKITELYEMGALMYEMVNPYNLIGANQKIFPCQ